MGRVREASAEVRIDVDDSSAKLRDALGRMRRVYGLRVRYVRSSDGLVRTDVTVEYRDAARTVPGAETVPGWLRDMIDLHRPNALLRSVEVSDTRAVRMGMGSFPTPLH